MNKVILFPVLVFALSVNLYAQQNFQWKGLELDVSMPQAAISVLGKPKNDKHENFACPISKNETNQSSDNSLHKLYFERIDDFKSVTLIFCNEKLRQIDFVPSKKAMLAASLNKIYGSDFLFLGKPTKAMKFADYEGQKETTVPKVYAALYYMLSVRKNSTIFALINNAGWKTVWRTATGKPTEELFPGYVQKIQVISRSF